VLELLHTLTNSFGPLKLYSTIIKISAILRP
jgi:hypothetical protein